MPKKTGEKYRKKIEQENREFRASVAASQPPSASTSAAEFDVVVSLADPLSIFLCHAKDEETVQSVMMSREFQAFRKQACAQWGLNPTDLDNQHLLVPPVPNPHQTLVADWKRAVDSTCVIPHPMIVFLLKSQIHGRPALLAKVAKVSSQFNDKVGDCFKCEADKEALEAKLAQCQAELLRARAGISPTVLTSMDVNMMLEKFEMKFAKQYEVIAKNQEAIAKNQEAIAKNQEVIAKNQEVIAQRNEEIEQLVRERNEKADAAQTLADTLRSSIFPAMKTMRGIQTRQLLETYRYHLVRKYDCSLEGEVRNNWGFCAEQLMQRSDLDPEEKDLMSYLDGRSGYYGHLSHFHVHNENQTSFAAAICSTVEQPLRRDLCRIYTRMYGTDPEADYFDANFQSISLI